ncbi:hypothetical protein C9374_009083 [Naegleria lovaniensis]|uniref:Xylose isomerase-like TIM barrel domain-containing protein n=1 Tax=Naegleria lovaniensis TaxID=51637 RepID=A0AA88GHP4_NAELO|nr:uncharacterized protein C9374_009083 [Naegleria lovaniensis]KAG2377567.1 hypothetical protein C9374_009083 [Naegleria lovaniensis]
MPASLAVSNIAWELHQDDQALDFLKEKGVGLLEVAPTKIIPEWIDFTPEAWGNFKKKILDKGLRVSSFQALSFKKNDLEIFHTDESRKAYVDHTKFVIDLAYELVKEPNSVAKSVRLVFGSPKTRDPRGKTYEECLQIATVFFRELGEYCLNKHKELGLEPTSDGVPAVCVCLEPNPKDYSCFFGYNIEQASQIVRETNNLGFRLHLDTACLTMAGDDLYSAIKDNADIVQHFHVSEPMLAKFHEVKCQHTRAAQALKEIGYNKVVSIEMRSNGDDSLKELGVAIDFVKNTYKEVLGL